jgi:hypothetical protein
MNRTRDLGLLVRVALFCCALPVLVRLPPRGLSSVLERLARPSASSTSVDVALLTRYVEGILRRGRPVLPDGCLPRGIALYYFLRRSGSNVTLRFGIGQPLGTAAGHCWLSKDHDPYLERVDPRPLFVEIFAIPQGAQ